MKTSELAKLKNNILAGIELAYQKLVETKIREDGELVFSKDGKIIRIKAKDLKTKKQN